MLAQQQTCSGVIMERNSSSDGNLTSRRNIQQPLSEPVNKLSDVQTTKQYSVYSVEVLQYILEW